AELPSGTPASSCTLAVRIAGRDEAELPATIASINPGAGVAVIFLAEPVALLELAERLRRAEAAPDAGAAAQANFAERLQLAKTGGREERMKLLRDPGKLLHVHVLKNPRITLEEVQWAA